MYPADYGFIPETLALDGDPLDVLVLVTEPTFPGCVMEVKPIGVFHMADDKGQMKSNLCTGIRSNMEFIRKLIRYQPTLIKEIEFLSSVQRP
jgi:inorganic pyrophosphatase